MLAATDPLTFKSLVITSQFKLLLILLAISNIANSTKQSVTYLRIHLSLSVTPDLLCHMVRVAGD